MQLLPFGPRHIDGNDASLITFADDLQTSLLAHSEDWMLRRGDLPAIHAQKNISRLDSGDGCGASRVDILKYPALSERRFVGKVGCAQRGPARSPAGAAVKEAQMRRMKLRQQIAHGLFKAIRRVCCFNQWPVALHSGLPIVIQLFRPIESLLQSGQHIVENGAAVASGKLDRMMPRRAD